MKRTNNKKDKNDSIELQKDAVNIGSSVTGALVGLALGGPIGAILGATASPALVMTYNILNRAIERRKERAIQILNHAFQIAKISPDDAILILNSDDSKVDDLLSLLRIIAETDPNFDNILSSIIGESIKTKQNYSRERLLILSDSIRNLRHVHLQILKAIFDAGGTLEATSIAEKVNVPIIELRSVVRDLELRGMILDTEKDPIEWKIRELGDMLINFTNHKKE